MNKRWYLRTDFKSGRVPYLLYFGCLLVLGSMNRPHISSITWHNDKPPLFNFSLCEYLMPVLALCCVLIVTAVFRETYRSRVFGYLTSLRPSLWQLLLKRLIAVYLTVAVPLCLYSGFAFWRIQQHFERYSAALAEQNSLEYGYPVPELSAAFPHLLVQLLCAAAAYILITLALMALTGDGKVSLLVYLTYGVAEYFGFRYFYGEYGIISGALQIYNRPEELLPGYTKTHLIASAVCLLLTVAITYKKMRSGNRK